MQFGCNKRYFDVAVQKYAQKLEQKYTLKTRKDEHDQNNGDDRLQNHPTNVHKSFFM